MNKYTRNIADLLSLSLEDALKVQDHMEDYSGIDFSECSKAEFNREARYSAEQIGLVTR